MNAFTSKMSAASLPVLRIGLSLVFLWFGSSQLADTASWTSYVPDWVAGISPLSPETLVHLNGAFEIVFGTLLLVGLLTRISALLLALHMAHITLMVGYSSIGVRDFGLTIATLALFLSDGRNFTIDNLLADRKPGSQEIRE